MRVGKVLSGAWLSWVVAMLAVLLALAPTGVAASQDDDDVDAETARAVTHFRHHGWQRPIFETHIHLYQVTRPGGVPWPPKEATLIYRDVLPAAYKAIALQNGIVAAGVVEASEEHTSELQSHLNLVCRLLLEKKK